MVVALGLGLVEPALAGAMQVGALSPTLSATGDCGCISTGPYANPDSGVLPSVTPTSTTTGKSPNDKYTLSTSPAPGGLAFVTVTRVSDNKVMLTTNGVVQWGFSPDDYRFEASFLSGSMDNVALYNLAGAVPSTPIWTSVVSVSSDAIRFSPSGRYLFYAYSFGGTTTLDLVDAQTGGLLFTDTFTPFIAGSSGNEGLASWGFGPDDSRFVYAYTTGQSSVSWNLVNLERPARSLPVKTLSIDSASGFWQFSPCGDLIAVLQQPNLAPPATVTIDVYKTNDGTSPGTTTAISSPVGTTTFKTTASSQVATNNAMDYMLASNTAAASCGNDTDLALTSVPSNITVNSSTTGAVVPYTAPTAVDEGVETATVSCSPTSGSTFPIGTTTVTCSATDSDDTPSTAMASFTVTVNHVDADLALTNIPGTILVRVTSSSGVPVNYTVPTATDEETPPAVICQPASGSIFLLGTTTVSCSAVDSDDTPSTATATFKVITGRPPHASFTYSPNPVARGDTVTFTDTSIADAGIASQSWSIGSNVFSGPTAKAKICQTVAVSLTVFDTLSQSDTTPALTIVVSATGQIISVPPGGSPQDGIAKACPGDTVSLPPGTYDGGMTLDGINLEGAGAGTTILDLSDSPETDGDPAGSTDSNQLIVLGDSRLPVTISGVTIQGGVEDGIDISVGDLTLRDSVVQNNAQYGIYNNGGLTLRDSVVQNNGWWGIYNVGSTVLIMSGSTLVGNGTVAAGAGGLFIESAASVVNSTVANNKGPGIAGGRNGSTLTNVTIAGNGGGIRAMGPLALVNTIVAGNPGGDCNAYAYTTTSANFAQPAVNSTVSVTVSTTVWMTVDQQLWVTTGGYYKVSSITDSTHVVLINLGYTGAAPGATVPTGSAVVAAGDPGSGGQGIASGGHNLASDATCPFTAVGDQNSVNPLLGPLADNAGPTPTMALGAGSPAVDAGDDASCPSTDQRGVARPQGPHCDIGAFELIATGSDADLALSGVPTNTTVNATSPGGAVVTYAAPSATDEETPPAVSCDHASGSTFPTGTTTVTCTATDADDLNSPVTASFTVTVTPPAVAVLPAVSNGAYGGYVTAATIQNTGTAPASVRIVYFDQSGARVGTGDSMSSLPVNASWTVRQNNGNSFPSSGGDGAQAGSAVVYSDQPVAVFVNEFAPGNVGDATSYSGVQVANGVGTTLYAPTIVNNAYGGYTTGIGLLNEGSSPTDVTITYLGGDGSVVKTQTVSGLAAHAYHALYSGDATLALPSGFSGTATITSTVAQPLGAVVNEVGPGGQFSSYDAVPAGGTALNVPVALNNAFGGYYTGMGIQNTSATAGTVTVTYYDAAGTPTVKSFPIGANGSVGVYQGSASDGPPVGAYTATITSTLPLAAIVNEVAPSTTSAKQSTSYNAFASGGPTLNLPLVENAGIDPWNTGEGIMNTGTGSTTVTVTYYNAATGAAVGAPQTQSLAPHAFWGLYQPTGGLPSGTRATAVITTASGGQVAAICNESSATTFMSYDGQ